MDTHVYSYTCTCMYAFYTVYTMYIVLLAFTNNMERSKVETEEQSLTEVWSVFCGSHTLQQLLTTQAREKLHCSHYMYIHRTCTCRLGGALRYQIVH